VGGRFSADSSVLSYIGFANKVWLLSATGAENAAAAIRKAMQMPEWVLTERYAIEARADGTSTKDQMRLMMQSLLAERFGFKAHFEERTLPAFTIELVNPGKTGPKLRPHSEGVPCDETPAKVDFSKLFPPACNGPGMIPMMQGPNRVARGGWRNATLAEMAEGLQGMGGVDRPMVDRTGLEGRYDFTIDFAPDYGFLGKSDAAADLPGSTFTQALRDQLGLKLESVKADIRLLVIDHIERPGGN
jgi:uncharacterized protein (TIGR03435 family)